MKKIILALGFAALMVAANGQNLKFAHINSQEILASMPDSEEAKKKLETTTKELEGQLEQMQVELNKKYDEYTTNREGYSNLIRQTKETELQEMQQRIQMFQMNAEQDLQKQKTDLFKPIYDKLNASIKKVAETNKFIYVFDIGYGSIAYYSDQSTDISELVKKDLGVIVAAPVK